MQRRTFLTLLGSAAGGLSAHNKLQADNPASGASKQLRVVAWNVACGQWCTPEEVGNALSERKPDLVLTNETPKFNRGVAAPDWSREIADRLGLEHVYVGSISSANHRAPDWGDVTGKYGGKFKSILSRWPISNTHDYRLAGAGWSPASAIRGQVSIDGSTWAIYSLHIPGHREWQPSKHRSLAEEVLADEPLQNIIVGGDFNVPTGSDVLAKLKEITGLENAITERAIDHIFYRSARSLRVAASGIERGPAGKGPRGGLSDHPYAWAEFIMDS